MLISIWIVHVRDDADYQIETGFFDRMNRMDRMKEAAGIQLKRIDRTCRAATESILKILFILSLLWLTFDSAQGLELAETAALAAD
jgi:hypothetical protein